MRRVITIGAILAVGFGLAGCTGEPDKSDTTTPSPSSTRGSTPTPTGTAGAAADEALLPIPVDEITAWAGTAVPDSETAGFEAGLSGWLGENSSPRERSTFQSLAPGSFQAQLACRGEGTITLTSGEAGQDETANPVVCTNETVAFDITTAQTGMQVLMELEGNPTVYALSLVRMA